MVANHPEPAGCGNRVQNPELSEEVYRTLRLLARRQLRSEACVLKLTGERVDRPLQNFPDGRMRSQFLLHPESPSAVPRATAAFVSAPEGFSAAQPHSVPVADDARATLHTLSLYRRCRRSTQEFAISESAQATTAPRSIGMHESGR